MHQANDLGAQFIKRRQCCQRLHAIHVEKRIAHRTAYEFELVVRLRKFHGHFRGSHGIDRCRKTRRAGQHIAERGIRSALNREFGELILRDFETGPGFAHFRPQISRLRHRQPEITGDDDNADCGEACVQTGNQIGLFSTVHAILHVFRCADMTHLLSRTGSLDSEPIRPARGVWLPDAPF